MWPLSLTVICIVFADGKAGFNQAAPVAYAQAVGDNSLGVDRSQIIQRIENGLPTDVIRGGAARGRNLFHSFEQFSVDTGRAVRFDNDGAIANIISRVTGTSVSTIDGLIRANGMANLFLINPNGIIFGANARLDIGGSFVASTANGIAFPDGFVYSAETSQSPPLLTVNTPIGLQMGDRPAAIRVLGNGDGFPDGQETAPTSVGLGVNDGQTLALIGGNISLNGGTLRTAGGQIEIGSVANGGEVGLDAHRNGFTTSFDGIDSFGTIRLGNQSIIDASGEGGGAINLQAGTVNLRGQSALRSDTLGAQDGRPIAIATDRFRLSQGSFVGAATFGTGDGGQIRLSATESARFEGEGIEVFQTTFIFGALFGFRSIFDRQSGLFTGTESSGNSGNIRITTPNLDLFDGAVVSAESLGEGNGGNVRIDGARTVRLIGSGVGANSLVFGVPLIDFTGQATGNSSVGIPAGDAGDLTILTNRLILNSGSFIGAATTGDGDAGDIRIRAAESVDLGAFFGVAFIPTNIITSTLGGRGEGGDIYIETRRLVVRDGAEISTDSGAIAIEGLIDSGGPAGNLTINASESVEVIGRTGNDVFASELISETVTDEDAGIVRISTDRLTIRDGAQISTSTLNDGNGGSLIIRARLVEVLGTSSVNSFPSGLFAASGDLTRRNQSGNLQGIRADGNAGALNITANRLVVQDGAEVAVSSVGMGDGGSLEVVANSIRLSRQGSITAATESGEGGNIRLNVRDTLLMRDASLISAQAGNDGNGGNIVVNAPNGYVLAVETENSDIIASADEGNGGNITITTQGIFGLTARSQLTDLSDINASSNTGFDGLININQPEVDPTDGTVELSEELSAPPLAQGCGVSSSQGQFVNVGRGGLPSNPAGSLEATSVWQDLEVIPTASGMQATIGRTTIGRPQSMPPGHPSSADASSAHDVTHHDVTLPNHDDLTSMIEAQGWQIDAQGRVVLTTDVARATPDSGIWANRRCESNN